MDKVIQGDEGYKDVLLDDEKRKQAKKKWDRVRDQLKLNEELCNLMDKLKWSVLPFNDNAFDLAEAKKAITEVLQDDKWKQHHFNEFLEMIKKLDEMSLD